MSLEFECISAHNYIKVLLLWAYICTHKFDVICISETYLDSDKSDDDDNLKIAGYNLIRGDHSSSTKRGGVCIYYKHSLAFKLLIIQKYHLEVKYVPLYHYSAHLVNRPTLSNILRIT